MYSWKYNRYKKAKKKEKPMPLFDKAGVTIKKKPNYVEILDKAKSLEIRYRDCMPNGYFKCISCGKIKPFAEADCGHFVSRKHMSTRFDDDNCHAECRYCNRFSADHLIGYQINLIKKIGQKRYETLLWKSKETKHWTESELKDMIKESRAKAKIYKEEKGL